MSLFGPSAADSLKLNLKNKTVFLNYLTDESLCGKVMFDYEAKETTTSTVMGHVKLDQTTPGFEFFNLDYTALPAFSMTGRSYTLTLIAYYENATDPKALYPMDVTEFDCSMRFDSVTGGLTKPGTDPTLFGPVPLNTVSAI